jgi:hypothetical protein
MNLKFMWQSRTRQRTPTAADVINGAAVDLHCNDSLYTPVAEDVGCKLAVRCVPVATAAPVGADASKSSTALMRGDACECVSGVNSNSSNVHVLVMCVHGVMLRQCCCWKL